MVEKADEAKPVVRRLQAHRRMASKLQNKSVLASLDLSSNQIRLLQFDVASAEARSTTTIRLVLCTFNLATAPPYIALSYTWGPLRPLHTIVRGGHEVQVRQNLFDFLWVAKSEPRLNTGKSWLWIDQLCIDQHNVQERNHQVSRMFEIYGKAKNVIVWLGPCYEGSDAMMQAISELQPPGDGPSCAVSRSLPTSHDSAWNQLLQLDYWNRLWVIQEILLAKSITVMLGASSVSWNKLSINCMRAALTSYQTENSRLMSIRAYRHSGQVSKFSWAEALGVSKGSVCQSKHDRIFAMLGLVREELRVQPDYTQTLMMVYKQVIDRQRTATISNLVPRVQITGLNVNDPVEEREIVERRLKRDICGIGMSNKPWSFERFVEVLERDLATESKFQFQSTQQYMTGFDPSTGRPVMDRNLLHDRFTLYPPSTLSPSD